MHLHSGAAGGRAARASESFVSAAVMVGAGVSQVLLRLGLLLGQPLLRGSAGGGSAGEGFIGGIKGRLRRRPSRLRLAHFSRPAPALIARWLSVGPVAAASASVGA